MTLREVAIVANQPRAFNLWSFSVEPRTLRGAGDGYWWAAAVSRRSVRRLGLPGPLVGALPSHENAISQRARAAFATRIRSSSRHLVAIIVMEHNTARVGGSSEVTTSVRRWELLPASPAHDSVRHALAA